MRAISSRRRPKLRVIGTEPQTARHVHVWRIMSVDHIVEVIPFGRWAELPEWERDFLDNASPMPGVGMIVIRCPRDRDEIEDTRDIQRQADAQWAEGRPGR